MTAATLRADCDKDSFLVLLVRGASADTPSTTKPVNQKLHAWTLLSVCSRSYYSLLPLLTTPLVCSSTDHMENLSPCRLLTSTLFKKQMLTACAVLSRTVVDAVLGYATSRALMCGKPVLQAADVITSPETDARSMCRLVVNACRWVFQQDLQYQSTDESSIQAAVKARLTKIR